MDKEQPTDIYQMRDLFNEIAKDIPSNLKNELDAEIKKFDINLNTIEAVINKTSPSIPWIEFDDILRSISNSLWNIWSAQDGEFQKKYFYQLYKLDRLINFFAIDKTETKLEELDQYYDKLSGENKKEMHKLEGKTKLLQTVVVDFLNYASEVTVINENYLNDTNIRKEAILSTLTFQIWNLMADQIGIYDDEGFLVDEFDDSKRKIN